ncbi:MAG: MgtC/SapB family protein [Candidatus Nanoarchaeia archaeon]
MFENFFGQNEITFLIGFILSFVAGIAIGIERESRNKAAGISTHTLVILGAMVFTFFSSIVDPASKTRIAAQIVTGVGFLGAGLIIKEGASVKNLTTAASLWFAAAIGMAFGFGFYFEGILATIASILIPRIPHYKKIIDKDNN